MDNLDTIANIAEIVGVIIVITGLYFGVLQISQYRQQRRELAAIELFRFFGNPDFTAAYQVVLRLPDGLTAEEFRTRQPQLENAAMLVGTTMENIGVMTFQRIVPFVVVNHLVGNNVIILWRKLELWVVALRVELGNDSAFEWFQWLAERMEDYQSRNLPPAYLAQKDWQPAHLLKKRANRRS